MLKRRSYRSSNLDPQRYEKRTWQDSNSQPLDPKSSALSIELLVHHHHNTIVCQPRYRVSRHLEIMPVILSAAKGLARRTKRSFAALRMTARTPLKSAHGKLSLQNAYRVRGLWALFVALLRACTQLAMKDGIIVVIS